jgi:hemerythrin-like domain-containing protein
VLVVRSDTRREFLRGTGALAAATLAGCAGAGTKEAEKKDDVSPSEDLMREHGLLNRVLLVYEEAARRVEAHEDAQLDALARAAGIVKRFVEGYHEKLEEEHIFPRFEKAGKLLDLVKVLREQHAAGSRLTDEVLRLAKPGADGLVRPLRLFVRMYRPHESREDTVLFPAFRELVTSKEWDTLGDQFEDKEHALFGDRGFENMVDEVAAIEKTFGIDDLSKFTPPG